MIVFFNWFTKITAWPLQKILFKTKIYYENKKVQGRIIKGPAIIISNHTNIFDYACYLFVFWNRTLRCQMAEVLYTHKVLGILLRLLGGIYVDRRTFDFSFMDKSLEILKKGGVVEIFPEARISLPEEKRPLKFTSSAAWIALKAKVHVIPVYTNGSYFKRKRARVIIGQPVNPWEYENPSLSNRENMVRLTEVFREKIIDLGKQLDEKTK